VQNLETLKLPWTVDQKSCTEVGRRRQALSPNCQQQVRLVGTFSIGTDFTSGNGNVVMSDQNFLRYFANLGTEIVAPSTPLILGCSKLPQMLM